MAQRRPQPRRAPRPRADEVALTRPLERTLHRGHPWIWADALRGLPAEAGRVVTVVDRSGRFVGRGLVDGGPIGIRLFTTCQREPVDETLARRRIEAAATLRDRVVPPRTTAYRLLNGEGDRLPGVVCDVYGESAVLRLDGSAATAWLPVWSRALEPVLRARQVTTLLLRSGRQQTRLVEPLWGRAPDEPVEVEEHGMRLLVDLLRGQKTGLFLDHRESRCRVRLLARGARVLNLFGYTGGFSVAAGLGGASMAETVDVAAGALTLAERSWSLNGLPAERHQTHGLDVFAFLTQAVEQERRWELVVSDPPSFAPSEAALPSALRSYRRLHELCLRALAPGGLLLAASCSSHVRLEPFTETLLDAADATRTSLQQLDRWGAPPDHPRLCGFPEGDYLKVLLVRSGGG